MKNAGHICERSVSCTKHERGRSFFVEESVLEDQEHAFSVFLFLWSITKDEDQIPTPSSPTTQTKLPQTNCYEVLTIEIVEGIRGYVKLS